jgi:hypothetical protein
MRNDQPSMEPTMAPFIDPLATDTSTTKKGNSGGGISQGNMFAIAGTVVGLIVLSTLFVYIKRKREADDDDGDDWNNYGIAKHDTATVQSGINLRNRKSNRTGNPMKSPVGCKNRDLGMSSPQDDIVTFEYSTGVNFSKGEASNEENDTTTIGTLSESSNLRSPSEFMSSIHSSIYEDEDKKEDGKLSSFSYSEVNSYMDHEEDSRNSSSECFPPNSQQISPRASEASISPVFTSSSLPESTFSDLDEDSSYSSNDNSSARSHSEFSLDYNDSLRSRSDFSSEDNGSLRSRSEFTEYLGTSSEYSRPSSRRRSSRLPSDSVASSRFDSDIGSSSIYSESNRSSIFSEYSTDSYATLPESGKRSTEFDV